LHRRLLVSAVLARSGLRDSAHKVLASTRALAPSATAWNVLAVYEAYTLALLGERQAAIRALGRLVERNPENRGWLVRHPWFRSLRDDPAFQRIVQAPN
jgi:predicted Zn-dependent protease